MCKQTQHLFQEVCQEKQHSSGIINDEYRINVTQFRTTIHRYKKNVLSENKILYFRVKVKKFQNHIYFIDNSSTGIYINFVKW